MIVVLPGSTARLKWTFKGDPSKASLVWYFTRRGGSTQEEIAFKYRTQDASITPSSLPGVAIENASTLVLKNVDERYNGKYRLNVQVVDGGGDAEAEFLVAGAPTMTFNCSSRVVLNEGDDVTCSCRGEDGNAPVSVTWYKDGVQIGEKGTERKTLTLRNVEKTASGSYKCVARSHTLLTDEKSVEIFVYYAVPPTVIMFMSTPENVVFGKSVVITCEAIAVPLPSYTIIHNDTEVISTYKTYIILALEYSHAGSYKCIATNHLGNSSKIFNLSVAGAQGKNHPTIINFGTEKAASEETNSTEWYIVMVILVSGIAFGLFLAYVFFCARRRWFGKRKPEQIPKPKTTEVEPTYQELDLTKMNTEDNYQSLRVNAASDGAANEDDSTYTQLTKTSEVENNYQSLT